MGLLQDIKYIILLRVKMKHWSNKFNLLEKNAEWEYIKLKIKTFLIKYAIDKCRFKRNKINQLNQEVSELEDKLNEDNVDTYKNKKQNLENLLEEKTKGCILRYKNLIG